MHHFSALGNESLGLRSFCLSVLYYGCQKARVLSPSPIPSSSGCGEAWRTDKRLGQRNLELSKPKALVWVDGFRTQPELRVSLGLSSHRTVMERFMLFQALIPAPWNVNPDPADL